MWHQAATDDRGKQRKEEEQAGGGQDPMQPSVSLCFLGVSVNLNHEVWITSARALLQLGHNWYQVTFNPQIHLCQRSLAILICLMSQATSSEQTLFAQSMGYKPNGSV